MRLTFRAVLILGRIRGDIHIQKTARRVSEPTTHRLGESGSHFSIMNISENLKPKSEWLET